MRWNTEYNWKDEVELTIYENKGRIHIINKKLRQQPHDIKRVITRTYEEADRLLNHASWHELQSILYYKEEVKNILNHNNNEDEK